MHICNNCKSRRIKTRTNKSYGKSVVSVIGCKDCGSRDVIKLEERKGRFNKR